MDRSRLQSFEEACRVEGVQATVQRRAVFEAFLGLGGHPTADEVFDAVGKRITGVSRSTVYRALDTFVRLGLIAKASHRGNSVRYDKHTEVHHHFACQICDALIDIDSPDLNELPVPDAVPEGFEAQDCVVEIRGICRKCKAKEAPL